MNMNERVRHFNDIIRQMQKRSVMPVRLLDVARMMEDSLPQNLSSDSIHFDKPKDEEWLNGMFQRHINNLKSDLVETNQFTLSSAPEAFLLQLGLWLTNWAEELILEGVRGAAEAGSWVRRPWKRMSKSVPHRKAL